MNLRDELRAQVGPRNYISDLCGRAADEIVRLCAELDAMKSESDAWQRAQKSAEALAEDRLQTIAVMQQEKLDAEARESDMREGLERIDWVEKQGFGLFPEGDEDEGFLGYAVTIGNSVVGSAPTIFDAIDEARAALSEKGGDA